MFAKIANRVHDGQRAERRRSIVADRVIARELVLLTIAMEHEHDAAGPSAPALPERGQVVNVRGASWAVTDVISQSPPRGAASASPGTGQDDDDPGVTHVVELQSLEEDQLGTELSVVWELEVGHTVAPDQGLPETIGPDEFDDPNTLAAFVDAVRWGAVTSADANSYQAPFRSGANVEAYQLEPLRRALQSARTNLLLADDVGLGKTIEAGLVVQELLLRHRARSVVIVCPPSLTLKWQDEMRGEVRPALRDRQQRPDGQGAAQPRAERQPVPDLPAGDRIHGVAAVGCARSGCCATCSPTSRTPAQRGGTPSTCSSWTRRTMWRPRPRPRSPGSAATRWTATARVATRALAEKCEHRLFLSATPHNGYSESFTALLEMIDGRRFKRGANLDERALRAIAVRRLKADLAKEKGFKQREFKSLTFTPSDDEVRDVRAARPDPHRRARELAAANVAAAASWRCCSRSGSCPARGRSR